MGWWSGIFSFWGDGSERPTSGKGTRADGTNYYQDEVVNPTNGFRVQRGEKGEKRIKYPTKDANVTKRLKDAD
jgi:hypothetical protein